MATGLKDIAKKAEVSLGTVSDILNRGRQHLYTPETRDRVLECSRELGYLPNRAARGMRSQRTGVIGFAISHFDGQGKLTNYNVYPFLAGLNQRLIRNGYHIALVDLGELESEGDFEMPVVLRERFFEGLVVHYGLSAHASQFAAQLGLPVVWWDSGIFAEKNCIYRDESVVGEMVTRRLIELGHQRIAFMVGHRGWRDYTAGQPVHYSYTKRFEAYQAQMRAHGLKPEALVGYDIDSLAEQLRDKQITAVVIQGPMSVMLFQVARALGWSVPEDLSIATCDYEPQISSNGWDTGGMSYDRLEAGRLAAEMMLAMVNEPTKAVATVRLLGQMRDGQTIARVGERRSMPG